MVKLLENVLRNILVRYGFISNYTGYNSENIIENLIKQTVYEIKNIDKINSFEIFLINDFSHDNSWKKIKLLSSKYTSVKGSALSEILTFIL